MSFEQKWDLRHASNRSTIGPDMARLLKEIRESKALTQVELSKLSGLSERAIVDLEFRRRKPRPSTRRRLARALKVRPEDIDFSQTRAEAQ